MKDKLQIIFIPTVIYILGLTVGYTFLHWLLFIKLDLFPLKQFILEFGIPMALSGLVVLFIIRPRCKILNLEVKRGNWLDFYSFMIWIILLVPTVIAQMYIVTASGTLTKLDSPNDIDPSALTKYYALIHYYIDKEHISTSSAMDVSGKYNQDFNMHVYVAMPILENAADTAMLKCAAWLGIEYQKRISNRLEPAEKENKFHEFVDESEMKFKNEGVSKFEYLDRIGHSEKRDGMLAASDRNKFLGPPIILVPIRESFGERNGGKLGGIGGSAAVGLVVWLIMILIPKVDEGQMMRVKERRPDEEARQETKDFFESLKPREGFFVTPIIMYINIGIYILMVIAALGFISFKGRDLLQWGANFGPVTRAGEWWRLLTNTFLHGGLMHVLANMYGLMFVGIFLEPLLGWKKYLTIYLATGILASMASLWWYDATVSVGASGAIFGLYGVFLALMLTKIFPADFGKAFLMSTLIFVGFNLLMGLTGGIDNAAHIGGLVNGFIAGLILYPGLKKQIHDAATEKITHQ